ncbi:MAG: SCO family protein [Hyphomonadaceae bacterium]|nr:SCO family protein [Hyphomonadaceae bacterium]
MAQAPAPKPRTSLAGVAVPLVASLGVVGLGVAWFAQESQRPSLPATPPQGCILGGLDRVGGPIALQDINGRPVTEADFAEGPSLVYFGFTHCPDICPTTMYLIADALNQLGPEGASLQPILITVDPERDTTDVMDAYVDTSGFPEGLVGLTGTPDQVRAVAVDGFKVSYRKVQVEGATDYTIDHSSMAYVMDDAWRTRALYNTIGGTPEGLAGCIRMALSPESGE